MFNPIQFERDPSWNEWPGFIRTDRFEVPSSLTFPAGGARIHSAADGASRVQPASWRLCDCTTAARTSSFRPFGAKHGSAIDPNRMLDIPSLEAFRATLEGHVLLEPNPKTKPFVMNAEFEKALSSLSATLSKLDRSQVYLVIAPVNLRQCPRRPAELSRRGRRKDCGPDLASNDRSSWIPRTSCWISCTRVIRRICTDGARIIYLPSNLPRPWLTGESCKDQPVTDPTRSGTPSQLRSPGRGCVGLAFTSLDRDCRSEPGETSSGGRLIMLWSTSPTIARWLPCPAYWRLRSAR